MRARAIAGDIDFAQRMLDETRQAVFAIRTEQLWTEIADMRERIEQERVRDSSTEIAFKTGAGGLMEVDFLAAGGLLERGIRLESGLPSTIDLLTASAPGPHLEGILTAYRFLRRVEARTRWVAGRAVEKLRLDHEDADVIADLVEPGLNPTTLRRRIEESREVIRRAYDMVIRAETIQALS
jgi:glutamine synthetase adenylyltransferase